MLLGCFIGKAVWFSSPSLTFQPNCQAWDFCRTESKHGVHKIWPFFCIYCSLWQIRLHVSWQGVEAWRRGCLKVKKSKRSFRAMWRVCGRCAPITQDSFPPQGNPWESTHICRRWRWGFPVSVQNCGDWTPSLMGALEKEASMVAESQF